MAEAQRRWGDQAFATEDYNFDLPYAVGYVPKPAKDRPAEFVVKGVGGTWAGAFTAADLLEAQT